MTSFDAICLTESNPQFNDAHTVCVTLKVYSELTPSCAFKLPCLPQLSPSFALHWHVKNGSTLVVGLDSDIVPGATAPWLALGLSEHGSMQGADMWIVSSNTSGAGGLRWHVGDYYSLQFAQPVLDMRQDVVMLGEPLVGPGHVTAVLSRQLQTCDPDDMPVQQGVLQVRGSCGVQTGHQAFTDVVIEGLLNTGCFLFM